MGLENRVSAPLPPGSATVRASRGSPSRVLSPLFVTVTLATVGRPPPPPRRAGPVRFRAQIGGKRAKTPEIVSVDCRSSRESEHPRGRDRKCDPFFERERVTSERERARFSARESLSFWGDPHAKP